MKILIVEDELRSRNGLKNLILKFQPAAEIETTENGEQALEQCSKKQFDLIFTDICMPNMDGLEMLQRLEQKTCCLVVISGYPDFRYAQQAMQYGVHEYLLKPVSPVKIKEVLKNAKAKYRLLQSVSLRTFLTEQEQMPIKLQEQALQRLQLKTVCLMGSVFVEQTETESEQMFSRLKTSLYHLAEEHEKECSVCCFCRKNTLVFLVSAENAEQCERLVNSFKCTLLPKTEVTWQISEATAQNLWQTYKTIMQKNIQDTANPVVRVKQYIQSHLQQPLTLNELAEKTYLNPTYLSKLFKKETGENLSDYIMLCRIEAAKKYLKDPQYKIYQVAELCGFNDPKYFSNVFKTTVGCSPKEYKNQ